MGKNCEGNISDNLLHAVDRPLTCVGNEDENGMARYG